ncbi:MAG: hypothetical protein H6847_03525 [Hyphomonas sp.]|nr:hypothetical protein [Hyphomonas sp.]MCA8905395.1 hypothetical protein [Hyphomonas sp.]MCB9970552.1 hypothetical protein [Hyphomonas sp.]
MSKGTLLTNNWLMPGIMLLVFATILTVYILQGHMAIELGGLELSVAPHEDGGVRLAVVRADHVSGLLPL